MAKRPSILFTSATEYEARIQDLKQQNQLLRKKLRDRDRVRVKPTPAQAEQAILNLPLFMQQAAKEVVTDTSMKELVIDVLERRNEFKADHVALLAGIGMNLKARDHIDKLLDKEWAQSRPYGPHSEVIIGGGLHAAIYAACRVKRGFPKPLVVEKSKHPGGTFACSTRPAFYLNSRNRPGMAASVPGDNQPLNYLPGCDLQPADMSGDEYQSNDVLAWVIRCNLALNAEVWAGKEIGSFRTNGRTKTFYSTTGRDLGYALGRVIVAVGPGPEKIISAEYVTVSKSSRIVTFMEFMGMMDKPFPMRGLRRVAVIGAGDAGKTAIEALTGQGPSMLTANSLDYPEVHWYGVPAGQRSRAEWENCNRSRYKGIGRLLTNANDRARSRRVILKGTTERSYNARAVEDGIEQAYVDGLPYDLVVQCVGNTGVNPFDTGNYGSFLTDAGGSSIAGVRGDAFTVGTCAKIAPSRIDLEQFKGVSENGTSIFYLARKTEKLAINLG